MNEEKIVEQAIDWMLRLELPDFTSADRAAFEHWRAADARHEIAFTNLTKSVHQFDVPRQLGATTEVLRLTLQQRKDRRKALQRIAALAGLSVGAAVLVNQVTPILGMNADLRTGTGERQIFTLEDGSVVTLNARSSADRWIDQSRRLLRLTEGELQVRVASLAQRPFVIETAFGSASTLSGTLLVRSLAERTEVVSLQSLANLATQNGQSGQLQPGQHTWFSRNAIASVQSNRGSENSWVDGYYTAFNEPLIDVVGALRPYRRGVIRVDPAVAQLRVSGAFPLDDSDHALNALAATLPVAVARFTPYWVTISAQA
ncbi:fecR family protein [Collimonas arenae]|uniref:FecR family protein n=1 Tax=Collimonas arenae TaxID=279058 RepID=A0A127PQH9_9BURK|nr:FecR domain-containing protein [Collimonas arenae]AMO99631.1 fecR family protein [Collimonas arenae]AMP09529.1 fecR family protein [Collimonas arenae]